jgi:hypothetical protein
MSSTTPVTPSPGKIQLYLAKPDPSSPGERIGIKFSSPKERGEFSTFLKELGLKTSTIPGNDNTLYLEPSTQDSNGLYTTGVYIADKGRGEVAINFGNQENADKFIERAGLVANRKDELTASNINNEDVFAPRGSSALYFDRKKMPPPSQGRDYSINIETTPPPVMQTGAGVAPPIITSTSTTPTDDTVLSTPGSVGATPAASISLTGSSPRSAPPLTLTGTDPVAPSLAFDGSSDVASKEDEVEKAPEAEKKKKEDEGNKNDKLSIYSLFSNEFMTAAIKTLKKAAESKNIVASVLKGIGKGVGNGVKAGYQVVKGAGKIAAGAGGMVISAVPALVGGAYNFGKGIPVKDSRAVKFFVTSAKSGLGRGLKDITRGVLSAIKAGVNVVQGAGPAIDFVTPKGKLFDKGGAAVKGAISWASTAVDKLDAGVAKLDLSNKLHPITALRNGVARVDRGIVNIDKWIGNKLGALLGKDKRKPNASPVTSASVSATTDTIVASTSTSTLTTPTPGPPAPEDTATIAVSTSTSTLTTPTPGPPAPEDTAPIAVSTSASTLTTPTPGPPTPGGAENLADRAEEVDANTKALKKAPGPEFQKIAGAPDASFTPALDHDKLEKDAQLKQQALAEKLAKELAEERARAPENTPPPVSKPGLKPGG